MARGPDRVDRATAPEADGGGSSLGDPSGRTMPQVNGAGEPRAAIVRPATAARGPVFVTRIPSSAIRIATLPSLSVR